jgi:hypothetical protein
MKLLLFSTLIIFTYLNQVLLFKVIPIDSDSLLGLFSSNSDTNTIKINPQYKQLPSIIKPDNVITLQAFFDEQCATECLKYLQCVSYLFNATNNLCQINLVDNFNREIFFESNEQFDQITELIECDLNDCSNSFYCESSQNELSKCLCSSSSTNADCSQNIKYIFSEWSDWSECSANCTNPKGLREKFSFQ